MQNHSSIINSSRAISALALALLLGACSQSATREPPAATPPASTPPPGNVRSPAGTPPAETRDESAFLAVNFENVPGDATPSLTVTGADGVSRTLNVDGIAALPPGTYTLQANAVTAAGRNYRAVLARDTIQLGAGERTEVRVAYELLQPGEVGVRLTPTDVTLAPGAQQAFTATIAGTADTAVTWTATGGTITQAGNTAVFTAPATPGSYTITATSTVNPQQSASATVLVRPPAPASGERLFVRQPELVSGLASVATDALGNAYVAGNRVEGDGSCSVAAPVPPFCSYDAYVAKFDPGGQLLWSKTFGAANPDPTTVQFETAFAVAADAQGNTYALSNAATPPPGAPGTAGPLGSFVKFDANGTPVWSQPLTNDGLTFTDLTSDAAGNIYGLLLGPRGAEGWTAGGAIVRFSPTGEELWRQPITLEGAFFAPGFGEGVQVAGRVPGTSNAALASFDVNGTPAAVRPLVTDGPAMLRSVSLDGQGNAYAVWVSGTGEGARPYFTVYDAQGNIIASHDIDWLQALDFPVQEGDPYDRFFDGGVVLANPDGSVYVEYNVITEGPGSNDRQRREYLAKYDATGRKVWLNRVEAFGSTFRGGTVLSRNGHLYQVGQAQGSLKDADAPNALLERQGYLIRWAP